LEAEIAKLDVKIDEVKASIADAELKKKKVEEEMGENQKKKNEIEKIKVQVQHHEDERTSLSEKVELLDRTLEEVCGLVQFNPCLGMIFFLS